MSRLVTSYIASSSGTGSRGIDALWSAIEARPQAATLYLSLVELGNTLSTSDRRVVVWGTNSPGSTNPHVQVFYDASVSGGVYAIRHTPGSVSVQASATEAPVPMQPFELAVSLAKDGAVRLHQSIAGGPITSVGPSTSAVLAQAWHLNRLYLNGPGNAGPLAYRVVHLARDVYDLPAMRRLAGTASR